MNTVLLCREEMRDIMERLNDFRREIAGNKFNDHEFTAGCLNGFEESFKKAGEIFARTSAVDDIAVESRREAAENLMAELKKVSFEIFGAKKEIVRKIAALRDSAVRRFRAVENARLGIARAYLGCGFKISGAKMDEARKKLEKIAGEALLEFPVIEYDGFDHGAALEYQAALDAAEAEIERRGDAAYRYIAELGRESEDELTGAVTVRKYMSAGELIAEKRANMKPAGREPGLLKKSEDALSRLVEFCGNQELREALAAFDAVKNEENPEKRILLYNGFILRCDALLARKKRSAAALDEMRSVRRRLKLIDTVGCGEMLREIELLEAAGDSAGFEKIRRRAFELIETETDRSNSIRMGEIIKAAFNELGYETDEGFDTLLIGNGKFFMDKPALKNYRVQIVSNSARSMVQLEVVRLAGPGRGQDEAGAAQRVRDAEIQTEFCADYEKAVEKIAKKGVLVKHKMRKKPGEVLVKKVPAEGADAKRTRSGGDVKLGEKAIPPRL
jgi:hypothetical protein